MPRELQWGSDMRGFSIFVTAALTANLLGAVARAAGAPGGGPPPRATCGLSMRGESYGLPGPGVAITTSASTGSGPREHPGHDDEPAPGASGGATPRALSLGPDPDAEYFLVTDFRVSHLAGNAGLDPVDAYLFTDSFGLMKRLSSRDAAGATVDLHLVEGDLAGGASIRYRRWLTRRQSLEVAAGYVPPDGRGLGGPIAEARYSPVPLFSVQVGVARFQENVHAYEPPAFVLRERSEHRWYGGVGCTGAAGLVAWGAQLVGFGALMIVFAGMGS